MATKTISPKASAKAEAKANALDLEGLKVAATEAGKATAAGHDSILVLGIKIFQGASYKSVATGDVKAVYRCYAEAVNASSKYSASIDLNNAKALKSATSKLTVFAKLASIPKADEKIGLVMRTISIANQELTATKKAKGGTHYERVLKVLRDAIKTPDAAPKKDAEIRALLFPVTAESVNPLLDDFDRLLAAAERLMPKDEEKRHPDYLSHSHYTKHIADGIRDTIKEYKEMLDGISPPEEKPNEGPDEDEDATIDAEDDDASDNATTEFPSKGEQPAINEDNPAINAADDVLTALTMRKAA